MLSEEFLWSFEVFQGVLKGFQGVSVGVQVVLGGFLGVSEDIHEVSGAFQGVFRGFQLSFVVSLRVFMEFQKVS